MRVIWLPQAKRQLRLTAGYILREFGQKARNEFIQEVHRANNLLADNPNTGAVETLLADRAIEYRSYVVNHLNKIIYFIKDDHIEVADFWNVRREPKKLQEQTCAHW
ncbi:MAG: type II toxin-antitoxin system RelE/ParE family toxin [Bacteroidaceae bacterium]|nr:type II toxin-antitoxin system RelE/ParE family toxin [Bacteroidaceae bacterium]